MNLYKVMFCGDLAVGKTSIIHRFMQNEFDEKVLPTIVCNCSIKTSILNQNNETINLEIIDSAGAENYRSAMTCFFKHAQTIVIVYDVTNIDTFNNLNNWLKLIENNSPGDVNLIIVGNKIDIQNKKIVSYDQLSAYASKVKAYSYIEVSAKNGENIHNLFLSISSAATVNNNRIEISLSQDGNKKKCC